MLASHILCCCFFFQLQQHGLQTACVIIRAASVSVTVPGVMDITTVPTDGMSYTVSKTLHFHVYHYIAVAAFYFSELSCCHDSDRLSF